METLSLSSIQAVVIANLLPIAWKLIGALLLWWIGGFVIKGLRAAFARMMTVRKIDTTLARYLEASFNVFLKLLLFIAVLSVLGIATTTFAAVLAAAGLAIGVAWSGLLANFAAGLFLMVLRPFQVGDMINAGGVVGTVRDIGLFATTIDTLDNLHTIVGNNKLFSDNIVNLSANPYRRVDLKMQLANGVDIVAVAAALRNRLSTLPGVQPDPAPSVELLEFNLAGPVLAVRPFCHNDVYWDVYFATNQAISDVARDNQLPPAEQPVLVRQR
ncbi:mechanosensitive ion channel family protein [Microvirgula aerodenitrificans]|uniref:mechanosensitive ion channel family protein n=1 Tax=Microvirgula aerodenitrificans TaxID=57480 RepID=UPI000685A8A9|nr:mechanosensitive ion channel family protein [Microvirgula aerodenitrificans]